MKEGGREERGGRRRWREEGRKEGRNHEIKTGRQAGRSN
jgi:hypothetical protein